MKIPSSNLSSWELKSHTAFKKGLQFSDKKLAISNSLKCDNEKKIGEREKFLQGGGQRL